MTTSPAPLSAATLAIAGLALQAPDVVDDMRAGFDGKPRRFRAIGVDRDQRAVLGQRLDHRQHPPLLLGRRDRDRGRFGRFAADIDDRSALVQHAARLRERLLDARKWPPSEKLSGVTLRMPTITALGPSSTSRPCARRQRRDLKGSISMVGACAACVAKMQRVCVV